jgi:hypothetical protein
MVSWSLSVVEQRLAWALTRELAKTAPVIDELKISMLNQ